VRRVRLCGQREVDEVIIGVNPDVQDGFIFHFVRLWVVGQHFLTNAEFTNGLLFTDEMSANG